MKRKNKNILLGVTCGILAVTSLACIGHITNNQTGWFDELRNQTDSILPEKDSVEIRDHGIRIKGLKSGTTTEGYQTKTFTYAIVPSTSTDQSVTTSLTYIDGSSCASEMLVSVDEEHKTITLTCLSEFEKEIILNVVSKANSSVKGEVKINYLKKVKSIVSSTSRYRPYGCTAYEPSQNVNNPLFSVTYSKYSKDVNYSFTASAGSIVVDDNGEYPSEYNSILSDLISEVYLPYILSNINGLYNSTTLPSTNKIINFLDNYSGNYADELKSKFFELYLANITGEQPDQGFNHSDYNVKFTINDVAIKANDNMFLVDDIKIEVCPSNFDYSSYIVNPTAINPEVGIIDF